MEGLYGVVMLIFLWKGCLRLYKEEGHSDFHLLYIQDNFTTTFFTENNSCSKVTEGEKKQLKHPTSPTLCDAVVDRNQQVKSSAGL